MVGIALIGLLTMSSVLYADEVRFQQAIFVDKFKADCLKDGFNLNDVDGFIENHGQTFKIFTYHSINESQLTILQKNMWKNIRK